MGVGVVAMDWPIASGVATWRQKHWEPCILLTQMNTLVLMRVTLRGFPGFVGSAGLGISIAGLGFSVTGVSNFSFGGTMGFDFYSKFMWKVMLILTQSINGLCRVSQWYLSTRVQLESKGVT